MIEEEAQRRLRLEALKKAGIDPYPTKGNRTHTAKAFLDAYEALTKADTPCALVGRIRTIRKHGALTFLVLEDESGKIQLILKQDVLGTEAYERFHETMDIGDFMEGSGRPFTTKKGEKSLLLGACRILSKALLPLPEKWHGLSDTETRYRQRYLDLIANENVRNLFRVRAAIVRTIRSFLDDRNFLEVETPILQAVPGGANAKPFVTHHNALDADLYLRIAPELYLKRLLVGGYERVYEIARCFRNEGIDHAHNPEFTQVEAYAAYMDDVELMDLLENLFQELIRAAGRDPSAVPFRGTMLNFSKPWPRLTYRDAMQKYAKLDLEEITDEAGIRAEAAKRNISCEKTDSYGTIIDRIYKQLVRTNIVQPTYLYDYPAALTPLAKRKADSPNYVGMFQLVYGGGEENIKAFSELNDPIDQEERFREQDAARARGDEEAQFSDDDYVVAMKHGMPPMAGFGIGIDRLTALLTDSANLKEVILFPTLRQGE